MGWQLSSSVALALLTQPSLVCISSLQWANCIELSNPINFWRGKPALLRCAPFGTCQPRYFTLIPIVIHIFPPALDNYCYIFMAQISTTKLTSLIDHDSSPSTISVLKVNTSFMIDLVSFLLLWVDHEKVAFTPELQSVPASFRPLPPYLKYSAIIIGNIL